MVQRMTMRRFFEILPGALAWLTILAMVFFSWRIPTAVAIFIILFDIYWLLKTIYLSLHLRSTFREMKRNLTIDWQRKLEELRQMANERFTRGDWYTIYHLVILPVYSEPYEVIKESFESLIKAHYPKDKFIVVLAIEERAGEKAQETAKKIKEEYRSSFFRLMVTIHPMNLRGEIPGKGSNETWAAKRAKELLIDPLRLNYDHILVSVFDIDTQVFPEYFGRLTYVFLTAEHPLRSIYQPIPLFTNNIYQAPAFARVVAFSATFWQMMQQSRPERLTTFSSQSLPFRVLTDIGFWDTDIVSEDSRIFWQGFLRYHGDFRVEPLFYPVSMDANVAPTFWQSMKNLYKQQRRWGWGVENIPYAFEGFLRDPLISWKAKWYWMTNKIEGFHSWATHSLMIFLLGWLPLMLGGKIFNATLLAYRLPYITRSIVGFSMIGIASSAILSVLLLPPRPQWFRVRHYFLYMLQWLLIPVTLIVFGAIPGLEAQTRLMLGGRFKLGFWVTPKSRERDRENASPPQ